MWNLLWSHWSIIYSDAIAWLHCPFQHRTKQSLISSVFGYYTLKTQKPIAWWFVQLKTLRRTAFRNITLCQYFIKSLQLCRRIYLAIWNQVSFAVQMNAKCLDINQNPKNNFLTDPLQPKSMIIGREHKEKRGGQDLKNIFLYQNAP